MLYAGDGDDIVTGGADNDEIDVGDGNNYADGGAGDDVIYYGYGDNIIKGGDGNDYIYNYSYSGSGNDIIEAGVGDDYIDSYGGNYGDDTYIYNIGDGNDTINEGTASSTADKIEFTSGISINDIVFTANADDLIVNFKDETQINGISTTDSITITAQLDDSNSAYRIETLEFLNLDGNVTDILDIADPAALTLTINYFGTDAAEILAGSNYADTLNSKLGNDEMIGYKGDDLYLYNLGDGLDVIRETSNIITDTSVNYGNDKIRLGSAITLDNLLFKKQLLI